MNLSKRLPPREAWPPVIATALGVTLLLLAALSLLLATVLTPRPAHADVPIPNELEALVDAGPAPDTLLDVGAGSSAEDVSAEDEPPLVFPPSLPPLELLQPAPMTVQEMVWAATVRWGMTPAQARQFDCIARRESGYNPRAIGPWTRYGTAKGVMQFIPGSWAVASHAVGLDGADVFDPAANIEAAAHFYLYGQGPGAWETVVPLHLC